MAAAPAPRSRLRSPRDFALSGAPRPDRTLRAGLPGSGADAPPGGAVPASSGRRSWGDHDNVNAGVADENASRALTAGERHNQIRPSFDEHPLVSNRTGFAAKTFNRPCRHQKGHRDFSPIRRPACLHRDYRRQLQRQTADRDGDDRASHKPWRGGQNPYRRIRGPSAYLTRRPVIPVAR